MSTRKELLREIEVFLKETGMTRTDFGERSMKDRTLMLTLTRGRQLKVDTLDKIRAYMAKERAKRFPSLEAAQSAAA